MKKIFFILLLLLSNTLFSFNIENTSYIIHNCSYPWTWDFYGIEGNLQQSIQEEEFINTYLNSLEYWNIGTKLKFNRCKSSQFYNPQLKPRPIRATINLFGLHDWTIFFYDKNNTIIGSVALGEKLPSTDIKKNFLLLSKITHFDLSKLKFVERRVRSDFKTLIRMLFGLDINTDYCVEKTTYSQ